MNFFLQTECDSETGYRFSYTPKPAGMSEPDYDRIVYSAIGTPLAGICLKRANGNEKAAEALVDAFAQSVKNMLKDKGVMSAIQEAMKEGEGT